nr:MULTISPECIES: alpha-glucosidase domain-containing protein [unclassified Nostoc]
MDPIPYAIAKHDWQEVELNLEQTDTNFSISTSKLKVIVEVDGSLKFCDRSGNILREELYSTSQII